MKAITKEKLQSILDCDEEAEQLTEGILDMIHSNDESLDDIGRSVVFAIINNAAADKNDVKITFIISKIPPP